MTTYSKTIAFLNTGTGSWTTPNDMNWNSFQISCLGCGCSGGGAWASTTNGTYSFVNGYGPGAIIPYTVGYPNGNTGINTSFGSTIYGSCMVAAESGYFGSNASGGSVANSIGMVKFAGGNSGTVYPDGTGGGGGAAGPNGNGGNGGYGSQNSNINGGGGGGASDGGTNGQNYNNLPANANGGISTFGANGGIGNGSDYSNNFINGFPGLPGKEFTLSNGTIIGCGSGGGGGWGDDGYNGVPGAGGLYGGGGGGDVNMMNSTGTGGTMGFILVQYNIGSMSSSIMMGC